MAVRNLIALNVVVQGLFISASLPDRDLLPLEMKSLYLKSSTCSL